MLGCLIKHVEDSSSRATPTRTCLALSSKLPEIQGPRRQHQHEPDHHPASSYPIIHNPVFISISRLIRNLRRLQGHPGQHRHELAWLCTPARKFQGHQGQHRHGAAQYSLPTPLETDGIQDNIDTNLRGRLFKSFQVAQEIEDNADTDLLGFVMQRLSKPWASQTRFS